MVKEVETKLEEIVDACKKMQVESLHLVGSAASMTDFTAESDIDFVYSMLSDYNRMPLSRKSYLDVTEMLENITGKPVDLITGERIRNRYFLDSLLAEKVKLYEA